MYYTIAIIVIYLCVHGYLVQRAKSKLLADKKREWQAEMLKNIYNALSKELSEEGAKEVRTDVDDLANSLFDSETIYQVKTPGAIQWWKDEWEERYGRYADALDVAFKARERAAKPE